MITEANYDVKQTVGQCSTVSETPTFRIRTLLDGARQLLNSQSVARDDFSVSTTDLHDTSPPPHTHTFI